METPLSKLGFVFLGTYIGVCAIFFNARSTHCLTENRQLQSPPRRPSPPPPDSQQPPDSPRRPNESRSTPDSTRPTPSPDSPRRPLISRSPPDSTRPTPPLPPPPPPPRPRVPRQPHKNNDGTGTKPSNPSTSSSLDVHKRKLPPPSSASGKMNSGIIVGLTFLSFAGILQIAVIVFLTIKKRQLA